MRSRRTFFSALAALAIAGGLFLYWPSGKSDEHGPIAAIEFGAGENSLLLVEPELLPNDYRSASHLKAALNEYLSTATSLGWIDERTIVVFPEHVATWLVAADAPPLAYRADHFAGAALALILRDPFQFAGSVLRSREDDPIAAALFRSRGKKMATAYTEIFSTLARDYGVTIAAGSIALEEPAVRGDEILTNPGPIYNVSAVFNPDGSLAGPLVFKRHPIPSELSFISEGSAAVPAFSTPAGRLGVLICADAWHPELYAELKSQMVDIVVAPSFLNEDDAWTHPWRGYVTPKPDDVANEDEAALSEGAAWLKYSLPSRFVSADAKVGGAPFLHGDLWDLGADGRTLAVVNGERFVGEERRGGAITLVRF